MTEGRLTLSAGWATGPLLSSEKAVRLWVPTTNFLLSTPRGTAGCGWWRRPFAPRTGPPLLAQWANGNMDETLRKCDSVYAELQDVLLGITAARRRRQADAARRWAKAAALGELHRATKIVESIPRKSASASKAHAGERTDYQAALQGAEEWGGIWEATASDHSAEIMRTVEALGTIKTLHPTIPLPVINDDSIFRQGRRLKGGTGLSTDGVRPWHFALASRGARRTLGGLLMGIERRRRWPDMVRVVVAVALGKRPGGARLIGISAALYRIWAKFRYADCRRVRE